jgi:hypothetical protein
VTLTIIFAVFGAIGLEQLPTGPAAADSCSDFVFNYPWLISGPLGAPASLDKNCLTESVKTFQLGAVCPDRPTSGLPAANFCTKFIVKYPVSVSKPTVAPTSADKNWWAESAKTFLLGAICPGRPTSGLPAANFCTKFILKYPVSVSKPTIAPTSADKNWWATLEFLFLLGAICPGRPPTGLPAVDFTTSLNKLLSTIGTIIWAWLICCSHNSGIKQNLNPAAGNNKGLEAGNRPSQPHNWLYLLHQTSPKKRLPDLGLLPPVNRSIVYASTIKPNPPVTPSEETQNDLPI